MPLPAFRLFIRPSLFLRLNRLRVNICANMTYPTYLITRLLQLLVLVFRKTLLRSTFRRHRPSTLPCMALARRFMRLARPLPQARFLLGRLARPLLGRMACPLLGRLARRLLGRLAHPLLGRPVRRLLLARRLSLILHRLAHASLHLMDHAPRIMTSGSSRRPPLLRLQLQRPRLLLLHLDTLWLLVNGIRLVATRPTPTAQFATIQVVALSLLLLPLIVITARTCLAVSYSR